MVMRYSGDAFSHINLTVRVPDNSNNSQPIGINFFFSDGYLSKDTYNIHVDDRSRGRGAMVKKG